MWGSIISAAVAALSSLFQGAQNKASARSQMRFQERMATTQYSRAMEDMRRAGLNPMLAYDQGGNAAPGGAGFSAPDAVSSALQAARVGAELKLLKEQTENVREDTDVKTSQRALNSVLYNKVLEEVQGTQLSNAYSKLLLPRAENLAGVEKTEFGKKAAFVDRILQMIGLGSRSVRDLSK